MRLGAAGKDQRKVVTAVARELLGFIWAIGTKAETIPIRNAQLVLLERKATDKLFFYQRDAL